MPLKKKNGFTLNLPLTHKDRSKQIIHQTQFGYYWCWAACTSMALQGFGTPLGQCKIAGRVLSGNCSELSKGSCNTAYKPFPSCDVPYKIDEIKSLWKTFSIEASPMRGPIASTAILKELRAGRPIEILLGPNYEDGHLVLLIDSAGEDKVLVADPAFDDVSPKSLADLVTGLYWGLWQWTWSELQIQPGEL